MLLPRYQSVHAQRAEQWFGADLYQALLRFDHYAPVAVLGMGGTVLAEHHDLIGPTRIGQYTSYAEHLAQRATRFWRRARAYAQREHGTLHAGFSSLSDLISEATTGGKQQFLNFTKAGTTGVAGVMNSLARVGAFPAGQTTAAAFAAGESPTKTTPTGLSLFYDNATGGDTLHLLSGVFVANVSSQLLMLYDRYYQGNWNVATSSQSVSGTPSRYQSTEAKGTFCSMEVSTALGATGGQNFTLTYVDQDGNTAEAGPNALTLVASSIVNRYPFATPDWKARLNAGDSGVRAITNLGLSAATATGNVNVFLGKPLALVPIPPVANQPIGVSFVNSLFSMTQIVDDSCLCLLEMWKSSTTATNYVGNLVVASG
jgi:hypothetical protein